MNRGFAVLIALLVLFGWGFAAVGPSAGPPSHFAMGRGAILSPSRPASGSPAPVCPTPQGTPNWNSTSFFQDVEVQFTVPHHPALSGPNFQTVPCTNELPMYLNGFWMNFTTSVPIFYGYVTVWGTAWPSPTNAAPPLAGFAPTSPVQMPLYVSPTAPQTASFFFNLYRFFPPGSSVYFNVTLDTQNATPTTIESAGGVYQEQLPAGTNDSATWQFSVSGPWWSTNVSDDLRIVTNPPVLGSPVYDPNPVQSLSITLESLSANGSLGLPIPEARLTVVLSGNVSGVFSVPFGPANHTVQSLSKPLGPYPSTNVSFNVTAWLPWNGNNIDTIVSPTYSFTWSRLGGWWYPNEGLAANARLSTNPTIPGSGTTLPTATPVNVSLVEPLPNVTIAASVVRFTYSDAGATSTGQVLMTGSMTNSTYLDIPGLPDHARLTFAVLAEDIYGVTENSNQSTYTEAGPVSPLPAPSTNFLFVEAVDVTNETLLPSFTFTIANSTWFSTGHSFPFGFGALEAPNGQSYLGLPLGTYTVTATAFGVTQQASVQLTSGVPPTIIFLFASGPVAGTGSAPISPVGLVPLVGLAAATALLVPLGRWYRIQRQQDEEERRRITL